MNHIGLKTRNNYLEDCHHLMLAGVAVRDASVTDISNADPPSEITNDAGDVTTLASASAAVDVTNAMEQSSARSDGPSNDDEDTAKLIREADGLPETSRPDRNASMEDYTDVLIEEANLMAEATTSTASASASAASASATSASAT